jgi:hypothetical protein
MCFHKILSPFKYDIAKCKEKYIDNICIMLLPISLNGLAKNLYMGIEIRSHNVDGIG